MSGADHVDAYPLQWPQGWPRTAPGDRRDGRFGTREGDITIGRATRRILDELSRMDSGTAVWTDIDPDGIVISTNLKRRLDGLPYSNQREPEDPGASVYFTRKGRPQVIPCDSYTKIAQNLAAIAATIEALRALERHGSGLMERAFTGFTALPPPMAGEAPWYEVLQCPSDAQYTRVKAAYYALRKASHPDHGGDANKFYAVTRAWESYCEQEGRRT